MYSSRVRAVSRYRGMRIEEITGTAATTDRVIAVVPAAGVGARLAAGRDKPYVMLGGQPIVIWALAALESSALVSQIVLVVREEERRRAEGLVARMRKVRRVVVGGVERQDSVRNALYAIDGADNPIVLIHDGVRPLLDHGTIERAIEGLRGCDGCVAAVPLKDTVKTVDGDGLVVATPDRKALRAVQTPQVFRYATVREAHESAAREGFRGTDDAQLVERLGGRVRLVMGAYENIKVTTPEDMEVAELFLRRRGEEGAR
jgi:2-C-methyl-D-erythritol 4-phosphate cytidylyltransferase